MRQVDLGHASVRAAYVIQATSSPFEEPVPTLLVVARLVDGDVETEVWSAIADYAQKHGIGPSIVARDEG